MRRLDLRGSHGIVLHQRKRRIGVISHTQLASEEAEEVILVSTHAVISKLTSARAHAGKKSPARKKYDLERFIDDSRRAVSSPQHKKAVKALPASFKF